LSNRYYRMARAESQLVSTFVAVEVSK